jgi:hypothetical protein
MATAKRMARNFFRAGVNAIRGVPEMDLGYGKLCVDGMIWQTGLTLALLMV